MLKWLISLIYQQPKHRSLKKRRIMLRNLHEAGYLRYQYR